MNYITIYKEIWEACMRWPASMTVCFQLSNNRKREWSSESAMGIESSENDRTNQRWGYIQQQEWSSDAAMGIELWQPQWSSESAMGMDSNESDQANQRWGWTAARVIERISGGLDTEGYNVSSDGNIRWGSDANHWRSVKQVSDGKSRCAATMREYEFVGGDAEDTARGSLREETTRRRCDDCRLHSEKDELACTNMQMYAHFCFLICLAQVLTASYRSPRTADVCVLHRKKNKNNL